MTNCTALRNKTCNIKMSNTTRSVGKYDQTQKYAEDQRQEHSQHKQEASTAMRIVYPIKTEKSIRTPFLIIHQQEVLDIIFTIMNSLPKNTSQRYINYECATKLYLFFNINEYGR